ncbi:MAG: GtrA family protein [Anaerolineales bacterium]|nr:GtrA family protein [Chloroflexota bacterium]MBL6982208.1 GtrA family protein [Anaerolineales bacterium]
MTAEAKTKDFGILKEFRSLETILQVIKYAAVGVSNTLIDAAAYYALTRWLWLGSLPILAKGIAYAIGMVNSFYWNRNWTFKSQRNPWKAAFLFTLTHIAALGINAGVMYLGLETFNLSEVISLGLATGAAFGWNFVLNKMVVFKN